MTGKNPTDSQSFPGIDPEMIKEHFGRTPGLFGQVCEAFMGEGHLCVTRIRSLGDGGDYKAMAMAAHSLKGSSTLFGAEDLQQAALAVQKAAEQERAEDLDGLLDDLEREMDRVLESLVRFSRGKRSF